MSVTTQPLDADLLSLGEKRSSFAWAVAVGAICSALILLIVLAWLTLANTNSTVNDVRNSQVDHNATLAHIDRLGGEIKAEIKGLDMGNAEVDRLLVLAGSTAAQLQHELGAVCEAVHASC